MHLYHHLTTWFLFSLLLLHRIQGDEHLAKDCLEYSLNLNSTSNKTPSVSLGDALEVSLQVAGNGELPLTQIVLYESKPSTYIKVSQGKATLNYGERHKNLILSSTQSSFSWINLVLDPIGVDTLLVYTPTDRLNVITVNVTVGPSVFVSSNEEAHVTFNCLSGCPIRDSSSALIRGKVKLQPPFTMYLNPIPRSPPMLLRLSITPMLRLTPDSGDNVTVNASKWTADKWHRVEILKAENNQEEKMEQLHNGTGVLIWARNTNYRITRLRGLRWTIHCAPKELLFDDSPSTDVSDPGTNMDGTSPSENGKGTGASEGKEGEKSKQKGGGAGAGMVTAWVMAGLALFLVIVLTLALCTKTTQSSSPNQFHDSQPSVGIVYYKGANREPEEDSEPESPNELKVPSYRNPHKQICKTYKEVED